MPVNPYIAYAVMAGVAAYGAKQSHDAQQDIKGPKELEAKSAREAEKRRLAQASKMSIGGETMFTTPVGIGGGGQLKSKLGQ